MWACQSSLSFILTHYSIIFCIFAHILKNTKRQSLSRKKFQKTKKKNKKKKQGKYSQMQRLCQIIFDIWMILITKTASGFLSQTRDRYRDQGSKKKHMTHWNYSSRLHTGWLLIFFLCTCPVLWIQLLAAMPWGDANLSCVTRQHINAANLVFTHLRLAPQTLPTSWCSSASF